MKRGQTPIVIDANVALKWFLPDEEEAHQALDILKRFSERRLNLISPELFPFEVINGLIAACLRKRMLRADALDSARQFLTFSIPRAPVDLGHAAELAIRADLSLYDATYLELAFRLKIPFVTADRRLFERGKTVHTQIIWLAKWKTQS